MVEQKISRNYQYGVYACMHSRYSIDIISIFIDQKRSGYRYHLFAARYENTS